MKTYNDIQVGDTVILAGKLNGVITAIESTRVLIRFPHTELWNNRNHLNLVLKTSDKPNHWIWP